MVINWKREFFCLNGHKLDKVRGLSDFSSPEPYKFKVHVASQIFIIGMTFIFVDFIDV